jgi:transposase InsO family protein
MSATALAAKPATRTRSNSQSRAAAGSAHEANPTPSDTTRDMRRLEDRLAGVEQGQQEQQQLLQTLNANVLSLTRSLALLTVVPPARITPTETKRESTYPPALSRSNSPCKPTGAVTLKTDHREEQGGSDTDSRAHSRSHSPVPRHRHLTTTPTASVPTRLVRVTLAHVPLKHGPTAAEFTVWKTAVINEFAANGVKQYLDADWYNIVPSVKLLHPQLTLEQLASYVKQQASMLCASLRISLGPHALILTAAVKASSNDVHTLMSVDSHSASSADENVHLLWKAALAKFEQVSQYNTAALMTQLNNLRFPATGNPSSTYNRFQTLVQQLADAGVSLPSPLIAVLMHKAIPNELQTISQSLATKSAFSPDEVWHAIKLNYDSTARPGNAARDSEAALAASLKSNGKGKGRNNNNNNSNKSGRTGLHCDNHPNTDNHATADCLSTKRKNGSTSSELVTFNVAWEVDYDSPLEPVDTALATTTDDSHSVYVTGNNDFVLDSGATRHIVCNPKLLKEKRSISPLPLITASHSVVHITTAGSVFLTDTLRLNNVCYLPKGTSNLLSVSRLQDNECIVKFAGAKGNRIATVTHQGKLLLTFKQINGLYIYTKELYSAEEAKVPDIQQVPFKRKIPLKGKEAEADADAARKALLKARAARIVAGSSSSSAAPTAASTHAVAKSIAETAFLVTEPKAVPSERDLQHARYCHQTLHAVDNCANCALAKQRRKAVHSTVKDEHKATRLLQRLHSDTLGPITATIDGVKQRVVTSLGGNLYSNTTVDEYSSYVWATGLKQKSDTANVVIELVKAASVQHGGAPVVEFHTDGGTEFINKTLKEFFASTGTTLTYTTTNSPFHNGYAESNNGILLSMTRAILIAASAPPSLWGEALATAAYVRNRTPLKRLKGITPFERRFGTKPDTDKLRVFGCNVFVVDTAPRGKLDPTAWPGIFVGYSATQNGYRILDPVTDKIVVTRDLRFDETSFTHLHARYPLRSPKTEHQTDGSHPMGRASVTDSTVIEFDATAVNPLTSELVDNTEPAEFPADGNDDSFPDFEQEDEPSTPTEPPTPRPSSILSPVSEEPATVAYDNFSQHTSTRSGRISVPVPRYGMIDYGDLPSIDRVAIGLAAVTDDLRMFTYKQAMASPDAAQWISSMQEELDALEKQNVASVVSCPIGVKPIACRWLFKQKFDASNNPIRYKSRVVAKGFQQRQGIDYDETYAPVARMQSIRTLLSLVAHQDLELKQLDFDVAFLNASLDSPLYMKIPEGVPHPPDSVWLLHKALYGLKQSPHVWNKEIDAHLRGLGYNPLSTDACIYVRELNDQQRITLALYVDDTLAAYHKSIEAEWLADKERIAARYAIKDLGDCHWILNMALVRDRKAGTILLHQQAYVEKLLANFGMTNCKDEPLPHPSSWTSSKSSTPRPSSTLLRDSASLSDSEHGIYRSIVGGLLYAANQTRIDIAYAVNRLCRFVAAPLQEHLHSAKHVLRYLNGTRSLGLVFQHYNSYTTVPTTNGGTLTLGADLQVYTDSSWADCLVDRKSTTGIVVKLYGNVVHWITKKQATVSLSSCEAEYMALSDATREASYARMFLAELVHRDQPEPVQLLTDSQSAEALVRNPATHARTKHIDVRHHYVRDVLVNNIITLHWLPTERQLADGLTKSLERTLFRRLREQLMLPPPQSHQSS